MKLFFLAWNFPPAVGGIEHVAWHVVKGLRHRGHACRGFGRFAPPADPESPLMRPRRPGLAAYLALAFTRAWGEVRRFKPDVIICPGIVDAPLGWLLSRVFRVPLVLLAHGSDLAHGGIAFRSTVRFLFRRARRVAANSASTRDRLIEAGVPASRIRVIHPGVDPAYAVPPDTANIAALRDKLGLADGPILLSAGRLIRRKGILEFIEQALPRLAAQYPDLTYLVAGGDAAQSLAHRERLLDTVRRRVTELGLDQHVRLLGEVSETELRALYAMADVFVLPVIPVPDDVEGFGIVLLEAALAGVPAVASRLGGIPEAVEDGVSGVLVEPCDWSRYVNVMTRLLSEPAARKKLADGAQRRAGEQFAWPAIVEQYVTLLRETMGTMAG